MSTSDLTPTVVLVHGAFVDASSWNGVIAELKAAGLDVVAPPNLLRGIGVDAAYLTGFVEALGRRVVLARRCGRHPGPHAAASVAKRLHDCRHWHTGVEDPAVLGDRRHRRSRHPPPRRTRHGQAGGQRDHRDQRLARGPGHASRRRGHSHHPRGQGHQMSAPAAGPFGPVQRIAAVVLDVGYVNIGPPGGQAVLLLHGWPSDIHSYGDVAHPRHRDLQRVARR